MRGDATRRRRGAAAAFVALVAVAGCSTKQAGHGFGPTFTTVAGLAAKLATGTDHLTSLHATLHVKADALDQLSTLDETMAQGDVSAMDDRIRTTYQGKTTNLHLIIASGKLYVDRSGQSAKPWVIATEDSSDPVVAQLAKNIGATLGQAGMHQYVVMVSAAQQFHLVGAEQLDGVACAHYHLSIDPRAAAKKLPGEQGQQMQQAADAGINAIPMDLWVDGNGRSIKLTDEVAAAGQKVTVEMRMGRFNENVSIDAPPDDQIADG
jgi:quinol monooxygenase YgiN